MVGKALDEAESRERKTELDRMAATLSRLGGRGYNVREDPGTYRLEDVDFDSDFDPDSDFDFDSDFDPDSDFDFDWEEGEPPNQTPHMDLVRMAPLQASELRVG